MKKEGHPDYHPITVVLTTGEEYESRSTYGTPGARLILDLDCHTWNEGNSSQGRKKIGRLGRYKKRYAWLDTDASAAAKASDASSPE